MHPFASRARRLSAVTAAAVLTVGLTASSASAVPNSCPINEIVVGWYGGPPVSDPVCPDMGDYLDHLFYPGSMYTTALSHSYRANVVVIQLALRDRHYSPLAVDGYYGNQTKNAVMRYQRNHHLVVDGKVGLRTWKSLFGLGAA